MTNVDMALMHGRTPPPPPVVGGDNSRVQVSLCGDCGRRQG